MGSVTNQADGDQHPVAVGRVGDVGPVEGAHLAPPHPRHEEEPGDHRVEAAAIEGDLVGDPPATPKTDPPKKRRMLLKWWVFR